MKQNKTVDGSKKIAKPSIRRVGTMLGSGALCVLTIGTISICGLVNQSVSIQKDTTTAAVTTTTTDERMPSTYTSVNTVAWRKASINEYEIAQTEATTTAKTTKHTTTTTEKIEETDMGNVKMYATQIANIRTNPDESADIVAMMAEDEFATVTSKTSNGWYAVQYDDYTGYVLKNNLTKTVPESAKTTTTKATTAEKKTTTEKSSETTSKKTTTTTEKAPAQTTVTSSTISYTDEEFDMLTYVLQGEVGNCSEQSKLAVANVIINRVKSNLFPSTISGVLTANNQFTAISGYYNRSTPPNQNTIDCAKRALAGEDNSNGATFYYAPQYCSSSTAAWFETLTLCLEIDGQRYFKN